MSRHRFGLGEYRYFREPYPEPVERIKQALWPRLRHGVSATEVRRGGHRESKIHGWLDCPCALRAIARGRYVTHRVFFADEATAAEGGFRPCGCCCRNRHRRWKSAEKNGEQWKT